MDPRGRQLVKAAIDVGVSPWESLEFQRLGDEAFDSILAELDKGQLAPRQQINALRALALLTKEFVPLRWEEVLDRGLPLATSDNIEVRSAAVNAAVWMTFILEGLGRPSPRERVQPVVSQAMNLGLDPEQASLAQGFLRNDPPDINLVEVRLGPYDPV